MIRGALAVSVTPLRASGTVVGEEAIDPLADFFLRGGLDGIRVLGRTGEGIVLSVPERTRMAERFLEAAGDRLAAAVAVVDPSEVLPAVAAR